MVRKGGRKEDPKETGQGINIVSWGKGKLRSARGGKFVAQGILFSYVSEVESMYPGNAKETRRERGQGNY